MRKRFRGSTSDIPTPLSRARIDAGMSDGSRSCPKVGMTIPLSRQRPAVFRITPCCSFPMILYMLVLRKPPERGRAVLDARHEDHRGDDERLEARLAVGPYPVALEHALRDLALRAAHPGDVRRQAVHIESAAAAREPHLRLVALPGLEPRVAREALPFERLEPLPVSLPEERRAPLHHREGRPRLRVDDVRVAEGVLHARRHGERPPALRAVLAREPDDLGD